MSITLGFFRVILVLTLLCEIALVVIAYKTYKESDFKPIFKFTLAFITLTGVALLRLLLPDLEKVLPPAHEMYETFIEMFQFLAAFFFGWGFYQIFEQRKKVES